MKQYIDKAAIVAEIKERINRDNEAAASYSDGSGHDYLCRVKEAVYKDLLSFLDTLEVKDPYEQCIQYSSIKDGIEAHAEVYSFNIESELFNQLTKEQQALWRKEIEQACISGGDAGYLLAKDPRYSENLGVKEVDLEKEYEEFVVDDPIFGYFITNDTMGMELAKHFFELGLKAQKGE